MSRALAFLLSILAPGLSAAMPLTEFGTSARASTANCISACTDFDFGAATITPTRSTAERSDFKGSARAEASLDPSLGLSTPLLRVEAFSEGGVGSAFATAFAVEGYTNVGAASEDYTLDITLTGTISDPTPADGDTTLTAEIVAYLPGGFFFSQSRPTLELEAGAVPVDEIRLVIDSASVVRVDGSISFRLAPGASIYVWALARAETEREESFADAFSTLTTRFDDPTGLVAASVPEPALTWLLASALAGLAAGRRR